MIAGGKDHPVSTLRVSEAPVQLGHARVPGQGRAAAQGQNRLK